ncbi:hypothetical protein GS688_07875 [Rhodococcus hoagii]|nr:hypothetical protein [Prescottella equi]NKT17612.1 hypothetical protein [Prescottella equi]
MTDSIRPLLTTWSARKAHIDSGATKSVYRGDHRPVTHCNADGVRAGEHSARGPLEQEAIDSLPVCGLCSRRQPKED